MYPTIIYDNGVLKRGDIQKNELVAVSSPVHLFEIEIYHPVLKIRFSPVYVLAEDEINAMSQAECILDLPFSSRHELREEIAEKSRVRQVPLMLRGWGAQQF